jgi:hypothetical protein
MIKKHIVGFSASFGLVVGIVMFMVGLALRGHASSVLIAPFLWLHAPIMMVLRPLQAVSYDWGSPAGLAQLFVAFLIYWTLIGLLAGFGLRAFLNRKYHAIAV